MYWNNLFFFKKKSFRLGLFISRILEHGFFSELHEKMRNFQNTCHHSDYIYKYNTKMSLLKTFI